MITQQTPSFLLLFMLILWKKPPKIRTEIGIVNPCIEKSLQNRLKCVIDDTKHNYYSNFANKLFNVQRDSKPYWSIIKTFLKKKKILIILPFIHENEFATNFKKKAELFNSFLAKKIFPNKQRQ